METLSKIELLIAKYRVAIKEAESTVDTIINIANIDDTTPTRLPIKFAAAQAMLDTYKKVISDLDTLLLP